jgi:hypothetical protein
MVTGENSTEDLLPERTKDWWKDHGKPVNNNEVFLYGYISDNGGQGKVTDTIRVNDDQYVIFPLINSEAAEKERAANDVSEYWKGTMYARINGEDITGSAEQRATNDGSTFYNGYWIKWKRLTKGTVLEFGGKGPRGFQTDATYTIVDETYVK